MELRSSVSNIPMVGPLYASRLAKLGIDTLEDLLMHVPSRYNDFRLVSAIKQCQPGEIVSIKAKLNSIKNIYAKSGKKFQIAEIEDASGKMHVIWFNQPFLVRNFTKDADYSFSGKVDWFDRKKTLISPEYENIIDGRTLLHTSRLVPVYPETAKLSSKYLRSKISLAYNA